MKKLLLLLSVVVSSISFAQDTLQRNNFFISGHRYPYTYLDSIHKNTVLLSGNNVTWDFSNAIPAGTPDTVYGIPPTATIFYNDPNCNYTITDLALYEPLGMPNFTYDDSLYSYYITDASSVQFDGHWAYNGIWEVWDYHMTDPETYFKFPFSLNDSFQDSYYGSSYDMSGSGMHKRYGTRTVTAEGAGTLILPTGTYTNCIKIKAERIERDSSAVLGVNVYTSYHYTWFQAATNGPILELKTDQNYYFIQAKHYFNNTTVGITERNAVFSTFLFPNPSSGKFMIETGAEKESKLQVIDMNGKLVFQQNVFMRTSMDLSFLNEGVYTVILENKDGVYTRKLVIVK